MFSARCRPGEGDDVSWTLSWVTVLSHGHLIPVGHGSVGTVTEWLDQEGSCPGLSAAYLSREEQGLRKAIRLEGF